MAAIITDRIKKAFLVNLFEDIEDSDTYFYAGLGRSEDWNDSDLAPNPTNSVFEQRKARTALQSVKNITDTTMVVPRENWTANAVYPAFNDNQAGFPDPNFYVMNDNQQVYVVLQQPKRVDGVALRSTVQPTGNTTGTPFRTSDGYVWKFLYSIGALKASKFITSAYIPITKIGSGAGELQIDSDSPAEDVEQQTVQNNAVAGQIIGYEVVNGGTFTSGTPTLTVVGDGTGALASAVISGNTISYVQVADSSDGTIAFGSGYTKADIVITGGGGTDSAQVRPIFGPPAGLGADPRDDLKASAIMFNTKVDGEEGGDFIIDQDVRQVLLLKNITQADSTALYTQETGLALSKLKLNSLSGTFTKDNTITGATSGAQALIDDVDSSNIFFHQNQETGFLDFDSGEQVTDGTATGNIVNVIKGDIDPLSGELLFIENRAAVQRSADQIEDVKIVIQL